MSSYTVSKVLDKISPKFYAKQMAKRVAKRCGTSSTKIMKLWSEHTQRGCESHEAENRAAYGLVFEKKLSLLQAKQVECKLIEKKELIEKIIPTQPAVIDKKKDYSEPDLCSQLPLHPETSLLINVKLNDSPPPPPLQTFSKSSLNNNLAPTDDACESKKIESAVENIKKSITSDRCVPPLIHIDTSNDVLFGDCEFGNNKNMDLSMSNLKTIEKKNTNDITNTVAETIKTINTTIAAKDNSRPVLTSVGEHVTAPLMEFLETTDTILVGTEISIALQKLNLNGRIDTLLREKNDSQCYVLRDLKTLLNPLNHARCFGTFRTAYFKHVPYSSKQRHIYQLNMYKYIIEQQYNVKVSRMFVHYVYQNKTFNIEEVFVAQEMENFLNDSKGFVKVMKRK